MDKEYYKLGKEEKRLQLMRKNLRKKCFIDMRKIVLKISSNLILEQTQLYYKKKMVKYSL